MNSCYNIIGSTKILNNSVGGGIVATIIQGGTVIGVQVGYLNNTNFPGYCCISNNGQCIYMNVSDWSNSSNGKPIYSTNGGVTFAYSTFSPALPNPNPPCQNVLASSNGQYILYTSGSTYLPYKSYDYGANFTQFTLTNFPSLTLNTSPICYNCGISDNGQIIAFTITGGSHHALYVCTNGSNTITSDVFAAYMTGFNNIQGCSMSTNGTYILTNNLNSTGYVQYVFNTSTLTYTNPGANPVNTSGYQSPYGQISDDGNRIWTIGDQGGTGHQTLQSNYYDAGASSPSWNLSFGESMWLGGAGPSIGYPVGQVNFSTCNTSSYMAMMITVMNQSSSVTSPYPQDKYNVVITTNNGVSWFNLPAVANTAGGIVDFTTIKINKSVCSKNGQWLLLNGYNNNQAYIVKFPSTNI